MDYPFDAPPSQEELHWQPADQCPRQPEGAPSGASNESMVGGESLDDIICDNSREPQRRRRSLPLASTSRVPYDYRMSAMAFGPHSDPLDEFQFSDDLGQAVDDDALPNFFGKGVGGSIGMGDQPATFARSNTSIMTTMPDPSYYNPPSNTLSDMTTFSDPDTGQIPPQHPAPMGLLDPPNLFSQFSNGSWLPAGPDFAMDMDVGNAPLSLEPFFGTADGLHTGQDQQNPRIDQPPFGLAPQAVSQGLEAKPGFPTQVSATVAPTSSGPIPRDVGRWNPYSKSNFDVVRALSLVTTRKNPQVQLGAVDMSCSFAVCDVTLDDCPIIYVSDNFHNLTGYSLDEINGRNCRFLQAPDGNVDAGTRREFVEDRAVYNLKVNIAARKEVQQRLINYRKGGTPFLNLITLIPIPWDTDEIRYFIGFQIDLVECPDAISGPDMGGVRVDYTHSDIGRSIWTPPVKIQRRPGNAQTLGVQDVSTLLQQYKSGGINSGWHRQSWDKMLLESADDVVHVLSVRGLFLYVSPSCKKVLEYDSTDLVGSPLSSICHPSDIVPVTRELKAIATGSPVNIVFRICRKQSGYTWFEARGSINVDHSTRRKYIILVGRKRPVFTLHRRDLEANGGIGDSEMWTKLSASGIFLFVSSDVGTLLDLPPESLQGTRIQDLMPTESLPEFGHSIEKARRGEIVSCKHEVQNKKCQVLQAQTTLYPADGFDGSKASFLLAQTKLLKPSLRTIAPAASGGAKSNAPTTDNAPTISVSQGGILPHLRPITPGDDGNNDTIDKLAADSCLSAPPASGSLTSLPQDAALASDSDVFEELKTTRCTSWQYELRQMEKANRLLAEELAQLLSKKRKRRRGSGNAVRDCANCHTRDTPEWRRGPSGERDLCNSCGLRWAKQQGRASPRSSTRGGTGAGLSEHSDSPMDSPLPARETTIPLPSLHPFGAGSGIGGSGMDMTAIGEGGFQGSLE